MVGRKKITFNDDESKFIIDYFQNKEKNAPNCRKYFKSDSIGCVRVSNYNPQ